MNALRTRTVVALLLQGLALTLLCLSLLGAPWLDARSRPRLLVLVDRSDSVPREQAEKAVADVVQAARAAGVGEIQRLEFAGRAALSSAGATAAAVDLAPAATNIEAALDAALVARSQAAFDHLVMISDGLANAGDAARALRAVHAAQGPLAWVAVGRAPPPTRIAEVLAPQRARVGQRVQVTVQLAGQLGPALRLKASARTPSGETRSASRDTAGADRITLELDAGRGGALVVDVALEELATGRTLDAFADAAVVDIVPPAAILYAQGSGGVLARSLQRGGWGLEVVPAARLDAHADGLDAYQAVVLDDVAISDAGPRFWKELAAAVQERGLGLLVLGGERAFARGGYRDSALEAILPVTSEPAALDQPVSVVFAVDKSGSMGQGSGGVDRFALAQRAVIETARGLTPRDALGLMVFDVAPRVLVPLGPAAAGMAALERDWQATPNGGTRLAPALAEAIGELERAGAARRMLVLVTDGFVEDAPLTDLRARLDRARIETIALAVGPQADAAALERFLGAQGLVLRVNEVAELPQVMRSGLERRRARVARGTIAVEQALALPFAPARLQRWPAVAAHAVTRARAGATVAVQSGRGEPLIAYQSAGRGRVVVVTCGLGRWTPQWLPWREWPRLAGGLAEWVAGAGGALSLVVSDLPGALRVEADVPLQASAGVSEAGGVSVAVNTPTAQSYSVAADALAPGRVGATLPDAGPGLYTLLVSTAQGSERRLHLRRQRAESQSWGTSPDLAVWRSAGLIRDWDPRWLTRHEGGPPVRRPLDRSLLALGLALFLAGVLVDRTQLGAGLRARVLQGWRRR